MLCKKLVKMKNVTAPCGQCVFCRINKKREWIARLLLEAASHPQTQFWTLTYEEENLPTQLAPAPAGSGISEVQQEKSRGHGTLGRHSRSHDQHGIPGPVQRAELDSVKLQPGTLFKPDLARFFKRVRKNYGQFRYFAVGEYGTQRGRPHYHVLAFGISLSPEQLCVAWGMGLIHIGDVQAASINYCVEYSLKREKRDELIDLRRQPEFAVMSTNPGIGAYAIDEFRQQILKSRPLPSGEFLIPEQFRLQGKMYPVPRYLRNALEDEGFVYGPKALRQYHKDEEVVRALLNDSAAASHEYKILTRLLRSYHGEDITHLVNEENAIREQRLLTAEARQRLFGKRHESL